MAAILIFFATYLVMAIGRLPGFRLDRAGAAVVGASLMIAFRVLTMEQAFAAIDFNTIALLFGMMIVVANLRLSGFFNVVTQRAIMHAHRPLVLLTAIVLISGIFSAFFVNDTMCIVLTPIVLDITSKLRRNPVPYLLAVAMAANIGSAATVTGNPQNMMIGSFSGIPYREFTLALAPVAAVGLGICIVILALLYHREFFAVTALQPLPAPARIHKALLWKSVSTAVVMIAFFFAGWPVPEVALLAGAFLLVTRRVKAEKFYREVDWPLLVLFAGLFVVIAGFEKSSLDSDLFIAISRFNAGRTGVLSAISAILSNIVSNVPAVLVLKPFIQHQASPERSWLALAMSSTLAGNLTILGSIANLIVVERARKKVAISFWEYARAGVPLTVITILFGVVLLNLR